MFKPTNVGWYMAFFVLNRKFGDKAVNLRMKKKNTKKGIDLFHQRDIILLKYPKILN